MRALRRPRIRHRLRAAATVAAAGALVAGCTTHTAPPISAYDLQQARLFKNFSVYWAGPQIAGYSLTAADNLADFQPGSGFALYYGDCLSRGTLRDAGCDLPLKITTNLYTPHSDVSYGPQHWVLLHGVPAVVYENGDAIEVYTDQQVIDIAAATPALANAAAAALTPFNRGITKSFPAFPQPYYTPNPSPAQLNPPAQATGPTGTTGATGATSDLGPPPALEPKPSEQS
jgi:hypothetical protein